MPLTDLIAAPDADIAAIGELLGSLDHDRRWQQLSGLDRAAQRALYRLASVDITLADLVGDAGPLTEVIHDGLNTLPVPGRLRRFQKRLCRATDDQLFGYNEGATRRLLGPGYFVAEPSGAASRDRGGVVIDYFRVPDGEVPTGWPTIVANSKGLQRLVYDGTRDFLRRVGPGVSIGAAYKGDKPLDHYFVLCRRA